MRKLRDELREPSLSGETAKMLCLAAADEIERLERELVDAKQQARNDEQRLRHKLRRAAERATEE